MSCIYGSKRHRGLTIEGQQQLFHRLTSESYQVFRGKQAKLFGAILECFGIRPTRTGWSFLPTGPHRHDSAPGHSGGSALFVPEKADETVRFQVRAIADWLESLREEKP